jgi:iron complex transport system substrate-binding protein
MRILSFHPVATELIFALGAGNMLVGRTDECAYPEAALRVPSLGKPGEIPLESVGILEPELVLLGPDQGYGGAMKVLKVDPARVLEIYMLLEQLGESFGKQVEADMLIHDLRTALEQIQLKTAKFHTVRVHVDGTVPQYVLELISIAGGTPHAGEGVEEFDPQYIIVVGDEEKAEIAAAKYPGLRAVQCERIYSIEEGLLRPTPRIVQGAKQLAKILHGVEINGQ